MVDLEMTIKALRDELEKRDQEIAQLRHTLHEYGIDEGIEMSDEYYICVNEIKKLKTLSEHNGSLTDKEVKSFEILNKSLQLIKNGIDKKTPKGKQINRDQLLSIVDGAKDNS